MNFQYKTELPFSPPATPQMRADALKGLTTAVPHSQFGSQYGDVMRAMGTANASSFGKAANMANLNYGIAQQDAERDLVFQGMQYMNDDAGRQRQLQAGRLGNMRNILGALL